MINNQRQHRRIEKHLTMQYCLADIYPLRWDISIVDNFSAGGIKFTTSGHVELNNKIIKLQFMIPELAPLIIELEAKVVDVRKHTNDKCFNVRAKFINLSERNKEHLSVIEKMIDSKDSKNKS